MYTYTMEYYSALRKEILPFVTIWMELEGISQRKKEKYYMTSLIYGSKRNWNSEKERIVCGYPGHRDEDDREMSVKSFRLLLIVIRLTSLRDLIYRLVIITNNTTIYLKVVHRVGHKYSCKKNEIIIR